MISTKFLKPAALAAFAVLVLGAISFAQQNPPTDDVTEESLDFTRVYALI